MQQHDVDDTTIRTSTQGTAWPPNTPDAREAEDYIFSSRPHPGVQDWENKGIVATKQHGGIRKDKLHQPQNTNSLRDTGLNTKHKVVEGEPAVILHAKNVNVGTIAEMGNPRQDQVAMGRVDSSGSTALVVLGFSIMYQ